jgi:hypothetical protein
MQSVLAPKQPIEGGCWVEPAKYSVKRFDFGDAFTVTHRVAVEYDISRIPRIVKIESESRPIWSADNFFSAKTIEQLIAEQGVRPIADIGIFAGAIPDEDVDEFVADIYRNRS